MDLTDDLWHGDGWRVETFGTWEPIRSGCRGEPPDFRQTQAFIVADDLRGVEK
jgi:hypothetical protein